MLCNCINRNKLFIKYNYKFYTVFLNQIQIIHDINFYVIVVTKKPYVRRKRFTKFLGPHIKFRNYPQEK